MQDFLSSAQKIPQRSSAVSLLLFLAFPGRRCYNANCDKIGSAVNYKRLIQMKNKYFYGIIAILAAVLILLVILAGNMEPQGPETQPSGTTTQPSGTTVPSTTQTPETTVPPTTVPPTTVPPETTVPPTTVPPTTAPPATEPPATEPPVTNPPSVDLPASWEDIGLYTRAELESLPTQSYGYGPGKASGGKRAPYAESDQQKYGKYGANFIAPDNGKIYLTFDCG